MTARQAPPRSFQDILMRLQAYWSSRGCAVMQPYR
jgi:glycyl-tRNA synthetase alpha chain